VADADGSDEKEVAAIDYPESLEYPAWSPDGEWIACAAGHSWGGKFMYVVAMRVGEWKLRQVSAQKWRWIGQMGWLAGSDGLLMVASDETSSPRQVWHLSFPGGEARRVTNDSATYVRMSLSSEARSLVALQQNRVTNVWLLPAEDPSRVRQITFGAGGYRGRLAWTPDGKIVCDSEVGEAATISVLDADGSNPKNLLGDLTGRVTAGLGAVTPDGRRIVYYSDLNGGVRHIWRMNVDGGDPIRLTGGTGESDPTVTPDGRWVVYTRLRTKDSEHPTLWKVSIDGGEPAQLTSEFTMRPAVSPDGKLIACFYAEEGKLDLSLAVFPFEGGRLLKTFPLPTGGTLDVAWTPDGRGLVYAKNPEDETSALWVQPLDGGPPRQLAGFENDQIFGFEWSRDGTQLACVRGLLATNVVLIQDFKAPE
jgi:Tol biopolymer transport system component